MHFHNKLQILVDERYTKTSLHEKQFLLGLQVFDVFLIRCHHCDLCFCFNSQTAFYSKMSDLMFICSNKEKFKVV